MKTQTAKHTAGPWKLDRRTGDIIGEKNLFVCRMYSASAVRSAWPTEEAETNAHLIAAAPELLEIAKGIVEAWRRAHREKPCAREFSCYVCKARVVITKAEGK